ncbi:ras-related protein Rab-5A, putative [Plasmodium knowlesi strain H]|uniref:Ras-related protein Rab-5A, putative n=3 Tax=Plasmodium knowlesi TaxID=5850 RepID=A0A5K1UHH5_PLAKH|nr:ras-related protein Rab-5A, putative [Plasmodium knowlesi strain H]OTN66824.1 putative Rab5 [Plasmodium knowlesi]CAA9986741.1 ras-related protein Rab-5A, putative [Plasmodium knowlesi strain H]SBO23564.1 ras-related protein Rab-5A, putative [Plasmodium knowlesi strain H]SBO25098.1 ras-related protein Rab-5A, putative [Plasmodium knowlesi strain H]VVS76215.1 ras-related protein Rab-5A, putative [Plasmodium knowlesi strain H]|eukprot:XP_002257925.1 rab5, putative [Plasmodium knowlesi strain H]
MEKKSSYKTVLLGESSVGKSSIVLRLTKDTFHDNTNTTIGASFCTYVVNMNELKMKNTNSGINSNDSSSNLSSNSNDNISSNKEQLKNNEGPCNIKFDIWDTAGQERYASIVPLYYRGATCAIVVFDISNSSSLDRAKTWVNQLKISSNYIIILVANKIDKNKFQVDMLDVQRYAQENNLLFIQTSAKTGVNIKNIFYMLAEEIYKNIINNKSNIDSKGTSTNLINLNSEKHVRKNCC